MTPEYETRWKWIPGWEGRYEVSSDGEVRAHYHRRFPDRKLDQPRVMKPYRPSGVRHYHAVTLLRPGEKRQRVQLHRCVLLAFVGAPPPGCEGAHLNGNRFDCRLVNLAWVSHAENMSHNVTNGTVARGKKMPGARLSDDAVREIRVRRGSGEYVSSIAASLGVHIQTVWSVIYGKSWGHVQ